MMYTVDLYPECAGGTYIGYSFSNERTESMNGHYVKMRITTKKVFHYYWRSFTHKQWSSLVQHRGKLY